MKAVYLLCGLLATAISAALVLIGNTAEASYLIQSEIFALLLQIEYNKEG